jgi:hypothetical protein
MNFSFINSVASSEDTTRSKMRWKDDRDSAMICKEADNSSGKIQENE